MDTLKQHEHSDSQKNNYQSPRLVLYGNLAEITQNVGIAGHADSPAHAPNHTSTH